ncbi:hypothetical protein SRABI128_03798 [Microbacterium sp. Bi128]|nr:hypothetical protein SRABI128_03798 [Microbacterium sp. Bi128]
MRIAGKGRSAAGRQVGSQRQGFRAQTVNGHDGEVVLGVKVHNAPRQCAATGRFHHWFVDPGDHMGVGHHAPGGDHEACSGLVLAALVGGSGDLEH